MTDCKSPPRPATPQKVERHWGEVGCVDSRWLPIWRLRALEAKVRPAQQGHLPKNSTSK